MAEVHLAAVAAVPALLQTVVEILLGEAGLVVLQVGALLGPCGLAAVVEELQGPS